MNILERFIRNNRSIFWTLVFIGGFYFFIFLISHSAAEKNAVPAEAKKVARMTAYEIKQKEETFEQNIQMHPRLLIALASFFLLAFCSGIFICIYMIMRKMGGLPIISQSLPQNGVPWGPKDTLEVFVFLFFVDTLVVFLEVVLNLFINLKHADKDLLLFINNLVRDTSLLGFLFFIVKKRFGRPLSEIGLTAKNLFKNIVTGIAGYIAVIPVLSVLLLCLMLAAQAFSYEPPPQPVVEIYLKKSANEHLLFFTFFVAVAGPLAEEIFFRGFVYKAFRGRFGVRWAAVCSAALFSALHMNCFIFLPIFFLGLFLVYLYERTGSLVPSITAHVIHNFVMVGATLIFKSLST